MNKKGDIRPALYLFAIIGIGFLFILFYIWQGAAYEAGKEIIIISEEVHKNPMLTKLLSYNVDSGRTIGDAIAYDELSKACVAAKKIMDKEKFILSLDGVDFCSSEKGPEKPAKIKALIPAEDNQIKEVVLEI
ncbi:hypothetical protein KY346_03080 [Candidatus Woesearchaeota archaeon]|nr:hypothetical protein [Candidatus Woesearchaeota archaeon]